MIKIIIFYFFFTLTFCQKSPIQIGEKLLFNASFTGINAANASLEVIQKTIIEKQTVYHIKYLANSTGIINYVFPINDEINLWLDAETLLPVKIHENIKEGKFNKSQTIIFNHKKGYAIINNDSIKIDKTTQSIYSLFYFFRKQNIMDFKNKNITLIQNGKTIILELDIKENENITVPAGQYTCTRISPKRKDKKQFKNKAEMDILLSNDIYKYPIKIWLNLKFGSLILELKKIIN